ncbi:MAG: hypothetical protein ABI543_14605, partial [Ignavibacteria bacterium]
MMKYVISILLSILLFFNSSLFTIMYSVKALELSFITPGKIRLAEANNEDENFYFENVCILKIAPNSVHTQNIKWLDENEFMLDGKYCDVTTRRSYNDTIYICFIYDHEEDELNTAATAHYQNEPGKNAAMRYFNILFSFLSNAI